MAGVYHGRDLVSWLMLLGPDSAVQRFDEKLDGIWGKKVRLAMVKVKHGGGLCMPPTTAVGCTTKTHPNDLPPSAGTVKSINQSTSIKSAVSRYSKMAQAAMVERVGEMK